MHLPCILSQSILLKTKCLYERGIRGSKRCPQKLDMTPIGFHQLPFRKDRLRLTQTMSSSIRLMPKIIPCNLTVMILGRMKTILKEKATSITALNKMLGM